MRATEFLLEAKPENLGDGLIKKLGQAYYKKSRTLPNAESTNPAEVDREYLATGYSLADYLYKQIGPKFLIWVVKQYIQDPHFMHEDIPAWADTLGDYTQAIQARLPIEKDINKFANINQLRTELRKHQESTVGKVYDTIVPALDKFVQKGHAAWLYKGKDYAIYRPDTWESSNEFHRVLNNKGIKPSICVTYGETYYEEYIAQGTFVITIAPDTAYVAYVNTHSEAGDSFYNVPSEFKDMYNNAEGASLEDQITMFPRLKPILTDYAKQSVDVNVLLVLDPDRANKVYPDLVKLIKKYEVRIIPRLDYIRAVWTDDIIQYMNVEQAENYEKVMNDPKNEDDIDRMAEIEEWYGDLELTVVGVSNTAKSVFNTPLALCIIPDSGFGDGVRYQLLPQENLFSEQHEDYVFNLFH